MFLVCLGFLMASMVPIGNRKSIAATYCSVTVSRSTHCFMTSHCSVSTFCSGWTTCCRESIHIRNNRWFGEVRELHDRFVEDGNISAIYVTFYITSRCYCYWKTNYKVSSQVTESYGNLQVQKKEWCTCVLCVITLFIIHLDAIINSDWLRTSKYQLIFAKTWYLLLIFAEVIFAEVICGSNICWIYICS